jgi:hypothetical protein
MLTAEELVKLIKAHNVLSQIKIPAKDRTNVRALIRLIEAKKYIVNHEKKRIEPRQQRGKIIDLKKAEEVVKPKPKKEQTAQQKEKRKMNERKRVIKFILENKEILNEPEVKKLHKGLK